MEDVLDTLFLAALSGMRRDSHINGLGVSLKQLDPVLDVDGEFVKRCNTSMVDLDPVLFELEQQAKLSRDLWRLGEADEENLKRLIEKHAKYTNSRRASEIIENWAAYRPRFVKIFPKEYRRALGELAAAHKRVAA